jgi:hypothetical protein
MKKILVLTTVGLFLLGSGSARALVIYDFTGECSTGCTGSASGTLVLADTFSGTPSDVDFVSFSFTSSNGTYTVPGDAVFLEFTPGGGALPTASGAADIFIDWTEGQSYFRTAISFFSDFTSGNVSASWASRLNSDAIIEAGRTYTWTRRVESARVPEPSTAALLLGALTAMWIMRRRRAELPGSAFSRV